MATLHAAVESTHDYETEYLVLGRLAWSGVSLYADEFTGQWAPLPFYLYGVTQLWGPSLALGRALSVLLGLSVVLLTYRLGGALAAGLVITHGLVVGSYSTVHFSPLTSLLLLAVVERQCHHQQPRKQQEAGDVAQRQPVSHLASKEQVAEQQAGQEDQQGLGNPSHAALLCLSALFWVKPNYWPALPLVGTALWLLQAPQKRMRTFLPPLAMLALPPLLFFAWRPEHLKLLAYVPLARAWVAEYGYVPWHALAEPAFWRSEYVTSGYLPALGFLLKRYAVWIGLALALLSKGVFTVVRSIFGA